jgi:hypothetical protein
LNDERFYAERDASGRLATDFLIITVTPNFLAERSFVRGERIISFAGLDGSGTKASALVLADADLLGRIQASVQGASSWQALVKVSQVNYRHDRPTPVSLDRTIRSTALQLPPDILTEFGGPSLADNRG